LTHDEKEARRQAVETSRNQALAVLVKAVTGDLAKAHEAASHVDTP
jgi:hypothetical protein